MNEKASDFVVSRIKQMQAYVPGWQPQSKEAAYIKLNTNENPFPPSPAVLYALRQAIKSKAYGQGLQLYPDPSVKALRQMIANDYGLSEDHVLIGNGSDEVLSLLFRGICDIRDCVISCEPSYSLYPVLAQAVGGRHKAVPLQDNWQVDFAALRKEVTSIKLPQGKVKLVILVNPNAPTSIAEKEEDILAFAKDNPCLTLIDEAYTAFMKKSLGDKAGSKNYPRLIICGTFSKSHSLAGQRIGWLLADPRLIEQLNKIRDSYNVNYLGQIAALAAWQDKKKLERRVNIIQNNRQFLCRELGKLGFMTLPASANFIFTQVPPPTPSSKSHASAYCQFLKERKIYIRHFTKPQRIENHVRITIGAKEELIQLIEATKEWLKT